MDTFTCEMCHKTYEKARTDEEALSEAQDKFGEELNQENAVVVCDDCYKIIME